MRFYRSDRTKGNVLFIALIFAFLALLIIAGLVAFWYRYTHTIFPIKVYTNIKQAAAGSVEMVATYIDTGFFKDMELGKCPSGTTPVNATGTSAVQCCKMVFKYKLLGSDKTFDNPVQVCLLGYKPQPGFSLTGVAYTPPSVKFGLNLLYGISSIAYGPQNATACIEAVYLK